MNFLKDLNPDQDDQVLEINEISEALLQYIYTNGITDATNPSPYDSAQSYLLKKESMKRKREEKINYVLKHRWDPSWLKLIRNRYCLPFVFISLIILIITISSSNWIRFDKQKAGLWRICNISDSTDNFRVIKNSSSIFNSSNEANLILKLRDAKKTSLVEKIKIIQKEIEICDSKIYLKEDTHLAIVGLSVIGVLFHLLGLILIVVGFCGYSRGSLYYYHSAGESLITSAFVNLLCLVAFLLLVSSEVEHRYEFDFGFYLHLIITILMFICSILLNLDEIVNEYRIWKVKNENFKPASNLVKTNLLISNF